MIGYKHTNIFHTQKAFKSVECAVAFIDSVRKDQLYSLQLLYGFGSGETAVMGEDHILLNFFQVFSVRKLNRNIF